MRLIPRKFRRDNKGLWGIRKSMKRRFVWFTVAASAAAALSIATGCAWFGGSEEEKALGDTDQFSEGGRGFSGDEAGPFEVKELQTVYFDYDRALIRDDQKPTLRSNTEAAQRHDEWRVLVIEGNCDERGTEEYNLALGERRAHATKQYMVNTGIPAARIDTVSFGESKPAAPGHDESAWKWNRRADFKVMR
jgi:peptidoglycan-associated lipoprotein